MYDGCNFYACFFVSFLRLNRYPPVISITHSSPLLHLAREATARVLHLAQSAAAKGTMSRLSPMILRSFSMVRSHLSLGRPLFLLP